MTGISTSRLMVHSSLLRGKSCCKPAHHLQSLNETCLSRCDYNPPVHRTRGFKVSKSQPAQTHIFWTNVWDRQTPDNWQSINLLRFITLCWVFLSFLTHLYMPHFLGNTQKLSDSCYTLTSLQKWNAYTKHCLKLVAFTKIKNINKTKKTNKQ